MPFTHRAGAFDGTDTASYALTIPTLAGGGVLWVAIASRGQSVDAPVATLTMSGATFTAVANVGPLPTRYRTSLFYSNDYAAGTSVALTIAFGANIQTGLYWTVEEQIPGTRTGSPVIQSNTANVTSTTPGTTLAAGAGEMYFSAFSLLNQTDGVPSGGGTELFQAGSGVTPVGTMETYWSAVQTAPFVTWTATAQTGVMAVEALAAPPPVAQAEISSASMEVPTPPAQAEISSAYMEIPDVPLPPVAQLSWAQLEVPTPPAAPDPWDPAPECETLEYRNPAGETVRFRTLIGTVGRFMPPIGVTTIPVPASHGSHYLGAAHLERPVAVPVAIPGPLDGRAELRRWAQVLDPSVGEGTLTVVEGTWAGRRLRCVYEAGLDEWGEMNRRVNQGTLLFRAAWPYWEDSNEFTVDVDQDDTTHTWFPFLPLILGASDAWAVFTVNNTGDVNAWPVITVRGPAEEVIVTNETTGAFWQVTGGLLPGSLLTADHRPGHKTVSIDGVNNFDKLTPSSSLWPLVRGVNQVSVGAAITDLDTLVSFTWRRNWLAA